MSAWIYAGYAESQKSFKMTPSHAITIKSYKSYMNREFYPVRKSWLLQTRTLPQYANKRYIILKNHIYDMWQDFKHVQLSL